MTDDACWRIERLLLSYATHADAGQPDALLALFVPDAELRVPGRTFTGQDRLGRFFGVGRSNDAAPHQTKHVLTNMVVDVVDGGRATAVTYFQVLQGVGISAWGRYIDELTEVDGEWRIVTCEIAVDGPQPTE
jgi:3-phenylpropionate/cinnamic acid dioxygenase small subunit